MSILILMANVDQELTFQKKGVSCLVTAIAAGEELEELKKQEDSRRVLGT